MEKRDSVSDGFAGGGEKSVGLKKGRADSGCDDRRGKMRRGKVKGPQLSGRRAVTTKNELIVESGHDRIVVKRGDAAMVTEEADGE